MGRINQSDRKLWLLIFFIIFLPSTWVEWYILNIFTPVGDIKGVLELFVVLSTQKDPMVMIQYYLTFISTVIAVGIITEIINDKIENLFG